MGMIVSGLRSMFPAKSNYTAESVPDLSGQVIIVTGANSGIGKETARVLLTKNAKVYLACRSAEKGAAAAEDLKQSTGKTDSDVVVLKLDLSDLASIKAAVDHFLQEEDRLDVLFNNGGIMIPPIDQLSAGGLDLQFATNVLGHFYLTTLLLPTLIASAKSSPTQKARVVNLSSQAHYYCPPRILGGPVIYSTLVDGKKRRRLGIAPLYAQSKGAVIMLSNAIARKYGDAGIVSTSVDPGIVSTDLFRTTPRLWTGIWRGLSIDIGTGALTSLFAGTSLEALEMNGKYLTPIARVDSPRSILTDVAKQDELWDWLEATVTALTNVDHN